MALVDRGFQKRDGFRDRSQCVRPQILVDSVIPFRIAEALVLAFAGLLRHQTRRAKMLGSEVLMHAQLHAIAPQTQ